MKNDIDIFIIIEFQFFLYHTEKITWSHFPYFCSSFTFGQCINNTKENPRVRSAYVADGPSTASRV